MQYLRLNPILEDITEKETIEFERLRFNGGENHIKLKSPVGEEVIIETQLKNSDYVMELLMATDALRRAGALWIGLLAPYIPYGRQDRVIVPGEPLSIRVFADLINLQKYDLVYTLDPHSSVTPALLNDCVEINNHRIIARFILQTNPNIILVSPDAGASKKVFSLAKKYNLSMIEASKKRDVSTGEILYTDVHCGSLMGSPCLIVDDICDGGRTFIELAKELKKKNAGKVILYVSHGIFAYGIDSLKEYIDQIVTTNCFRLDHEIKNWKDFRVLKLRKGDLK